MLAVAWSGAALFLGSLLYFAYFFLVQLGQPATVPAEFVPGAVGLNVLLFSGFALHHSVFARSGAKAWLARRLPRGLDRSAYVWLASVLFLAVCVMWQPVPGTAWQVSGLGRWVLHAAQLGGLVLTLRSAARIDIWELAGVRQARAASSRAGLTAPSAAPVAERSASAPNAAPVPGRSASLSAPSAAPVSISTSSAASQSAETAASAPSAATADGTALEISGPYRWLRHPIYLGWVLLVFGAPTMTAGRLLFAAVSTLYLIVAIPYEERSLTSEFGPAYVEYQRQVRWRLIPGVW